MEYNELREHLSVDQRASIARVQMVLFDTLEKCTTEKEVTILFHALSAKIQQMAINRVLSITDSFVEIVTESEIKTEENAVKEA